MAPERSNLELIARLKRADRNMETGAIQALHFDEWAGILGAAPIALSHLGECYLAASSPNSAHIILDVTDSRYTNVRANLVHCVNLGREAFQEAELQMGKVQLSTRHICEPRGLIEKIVKGMKNERLVQTLVPKYLDRLEDMAKRCTLGTEIIDTKFKAWMKNAQNIHEACEQARGGTKKALDKNKEAMFDATVQKTEFQIQTETAEKAENVAQTELDKATAEMWAAMKSAKPSFKNMALDIGEGAVRFSKDAAHRVLDIAEEVARNGLYPWNYPPPPPNYPSPQATVPPPYQQTQNLPNVEDFSFILLTTDVENRFFVMCRLAAQDKSIDDMIENYGPPQVQLFKDLIEGLQTQLEQRSLVQSTDIAAVGIKTSLTNALATLREMKTAAENKKEDHQKNRAAEAWRETLAASLASYQNHADQIRNRTKQSFANSAKAEYNSQNKTPSLAQQRLERVAEGNKRKAMLAEAHRLAQEKRDEAKRKLQEAEQRIKRLSNEKLTLDDIIEILGECFQALVELQKDIQKLSNFFGQLHSVVEHLAKNTLPDFLDETREGALEEAEATANVLRISYAVTFELASMYIEVSKSQIMPGLELLSTLSLVEHKDRSEKTNTMMTSYSENARLVINKIADKRSKELRTALLLDDMDREFEEVS